MKVGDKVSTEIGEGVIARKDVAGSMWHNRWIRSLHLGRSQQTISGSLKMN